MANKPTPLTKRLVLLDTHAIIHRSYHALPPLTNSKGEPTGAVYGVAAFLIKLANDLHPDYLAAAFDLPEPTFRHDAYEGYKAQRPEAPDDLITQFDLSRELVTAFGIPIFEAKGFEADDIIGTLAHQFGDEPGLEVIIASGDLDTLQLVKGEKVKVYTLRKGIQDTVMYDEKGVIDRYGFGPSRVPDYKGLKGDPSDNIIGVKGVGEKGATELIMQYGNLEGIYKELRKEGGAPEVKKGLRAKMLEGEDDAYFSRELATIRRDAPVNPSLRDLVWTLPVEEVKKACERFEFRSLISRLPREKSVVSSDVQPSLGSVGMVSGDTLELTGTTLSAFRSSASAWHMIAPDGENFFIATERGVWRCVRALAPRVAEALGGSIRGSDTKKFLHAVLEHGGALPEIVWDIRIADWILSPDTKGGEIAECAARVGVRVNDYELYMHAKEIIAAQETALQKAKLLAIATEMEFPLITVLARMEHTGITIDRRGLADIARTLESELKATEKAIYAHAGKEFNIASPKQLGEILFGELKLGTSIKMKGTATQEFSTRETELEKIRHEHPIVECVLKYREVAKLLTTYVRTLPDLIAQDGRVHTTYEQTGTATGRLSSRDPNLQNIPSRSEWGLAVKRAFVSDNGYTLLACDYSQIELRIAASLSKDKKMIEIFERGEDFHTATAALVNKISLDKVTPDMRRDAKVVNFGILFGMGSNALAANTGMTRDEAGAYIQAYFAAYAGLARWIEETKTSATKLGYVETIYGRRRYVPAMQSRQFRALREAERIAVNAPIQGSEADIIKRAMLAIHHAFAERNDVRLLLQVHDELVFELPENQCDELAPQLQKLMESAGELAVPIMVDLKIGHNWADLKKKTK